MEALLIHYMAPIMFAALVVFLLLGYPVAFSLGAVGLIFGLIGIEVGLFRPDFLQALPERVYGVIAASGTVAQIIPPSLVLIVMADQLGRSVGDMYEGAFLPGLTLAGLYAAYVFAVTLLYPKAAPGLPVDAIGYREPDGARGVWQLGVLVLFSGLVAYQVMSQTNVRSGADFV